MNKSEVLDLLNQKYDLEEQNISDYQKIRELGRNRLKRIKQIDQVENRIRVIFDRKQITRGKIR